VIRRNYIFVPPRLNEYWRVVDEHLLPCAEELIATSPQTTVLVRDAFFVNHPTVIVFVILASEANNTETIQHVMTLKNHTQIRTPERRETH